MIIQVQSFIIKCLSFRWVSFVQGYTCRLCIEKLCTWIILSIIKIDLALATVETFCVMVSVNEWDASCSPSKDVDIYDLKQRTFLNFAMVKTEWNYLNLLRRYHTSKSYEIYCHGRGKYPTLNLHIFQNFLLRLRSQ